MTKVELLRWLYLRDNYLVRALLICLSFCLFFPSLCSLSLFQNIYSFGMPVEGIYTQDCARWQLKGHSWQDVKKTGKYFQPKIALYVYIRLHSSTCMFPDLRIHSRSQRMVDCCVFVTISYSFTLLPVQIHVMGKAEGSKTKVRTSHIEMKQKWNIPKNTFST